MDIKELQKYMQDLHSDLDREVGEVVNQLLAMEDLYDDELLDGLDEYQDLVEHSTYIAAKRDMLSQLLQKIGQ